MSGKAENNKTDYWLELCGEDILTAHALLNAGRLLHMGFFCHLTVEKALKAVIADITSEVPPKIHDLNKLAARGNILNSLSDERLALLDRLTPLHIEARYNEYKGKINETLTTDHCKQLLAETEAFLCWIKQRLGK